MLYEDVYKTPDLFDFSIESLGAPRYVNAVNNRSFVSDDQRVIFGDNLAEIERLVRAGQPVPSFEKGGPREKLFHDPAKTRAAIVTCGGLCPGLNDVIKALVENLTYNYGVTDILGIRYGYRGLNPALAAPPMLLDTDSVDKIHQEGGTILGSSRGSQKIDVMVDYLLNENIDVLFSVGGDGTLRGAHMIARELQRRGAPVGVVGVPKTIDNDLSFIGRSFGFETSVYSTGQTLTAAHMEAKGALNGVGLVKLMGRDSGFIAAYASLANTVVNFCLIPEDSFALEGENGLLKALERRFDSGKDHAVIVVAEGAGQHLFENAVDTKDASGNVLKQDIGLFLKDKISAYLKEREIPGTVKYFDPSYFIRSVPAYGTDAILCNGLAEHAVDAAMSGKTDLVIGHNGHQFVNVPIHLATMERQKIDTSGSIWNSVLTATQQNKYFGN